MELYTDTYYIERTLNGDVSCFTCLTDKYSRPIFSLVIKIVRSKEDAEELTQDIFLKIFKNLSAFKGECKFSTWVYRIAYNTALSAIRKKKEEWLAIDESVINNFPDSAVEDTFSESPEDRQVYLLDKALYLLPAEERALILLHYIEEKNIDEIAIISNLTNSNVKVRLHRIRKKLAILIKKMEDEE